MANRPSQPSSDPYSQLQLPSADINERLAADIAKRRDSVVDPLLESNENAMSQNKLDPELEIELFGEIGMEGIPSIADNQNQTTQLTYPFNGDISADDAMQVDDETDSTANVQQQVANEKRDSKTEQDGKFPAQTSSGVGSQPSGLQTSIKTSAGPSSCQNGAGSSSGSNVATSSQNQAQMEQGRPSGPRSVQSGGLALPPPSAAIPAGMLYTIKPSDAVKPARDQQKDPFICARLASVVVTLFRMGKAKEAKALGQFGIDLMGGDTWAEWLHLYMNAAPENGEDEGVMLLLADVVTVLKRSDPRSAGFLSILMGFMG